MKTSLSSLLLALLFAACGSSGGGGPASVCSAPTANPCTACIEQSCSAEASSCADFANGVYTGDCGKWTGCLCQCGSGSACTNTCFPERNQACSDCLGRSGLSACIFQHCVSVCSQSNP